MMHAFHNSPSEAPSRLRMVAAFLAVYVFWGATFLFIKFGIETIPPWIMAGTRHILAGLIVYLWVRAHGAGRPDWRQWAAAGVTGALLLAGGNGAVSWATLRVPSGLAALVLGLTPIWMALLDWYRPNGVKPTRRIVLVLVMGLAGVILLVGPARFAGSDRIDPLGAAVLLLATLCWATGSIYSRHMPLPASLMQTIGMQSIAGGLACWLIGLAAGEWARLEVAAISPKSAVSFGYLVVFGSIVGFSCYIWLLRVTKAAYVSTYAYVNPMVAVFLGWAFGGEEITLRTLLAAALILGAVVLLISERVRREPRGQPGGAAQAGALPALQPKASGQAGGPVREPSAD
ncbi:MAG TPA: EamA family transporter [Candidatus Acidoferrales bacterium]